MALQVDRDRKYVCGVPRERKWSKDDALARDQNPKFNPAPQGQGHNTIIGTGSLNNADNSAQDIPYYFYSGTDSAFRTTLASQSMVSPFSNDQAMNGNIHELCRILPEIPTPAFRSESSSFSWGSPASSEY